MAEPADADLVLSALRLGWYVAEVRGRNRPQGPTPHDGGKLPDRADHQLPLRFERSPEELRIEAQGVLVGLAIKLKVDDDHGTTTHAIGDQAEALDKARQANDESVIKVRWNDLADALFRFDASVQDTLTTVSDTQACAYQLGRGLAECYWSLNIEPPPQHDEQPTSDSWAFLLGKARCEELTRLAGRLSTYFPPFAGAAIAGTLSAWRTIASSPAWRQQDDAQKALYGQIRRWYDVLILGQDPSSLVRPYAILRNFRAILQGFQAFLPQLLLGIASLAALSGLIDLMNTSSGNAVAKSVLGIASAVGLSGTGITTRLKNTSQSLTKRLKQDAFSDLVAIYTTVAPTLPGRLTGLPGLSADRKRDRAVSRAVRTRELSAITEHAA